MAEQEDSEHDISDGKQQAFADNLNATYGAGGDPESDDERDKRFVNEELGEQRNGSNGNFSNTDCDKASMLPLADDWRC